MPCSSALIRNCGNRVAAGPHCHFQARARLVCRFRHGVNQSRLQDNTAFPLGAWALARCATNGDLPRNKPWSSNGAATRQGVHFVATAETTLRFRLARSHWKSVVTSSAENGNTSSILIESFPTPPDRRRLGAKSLMSIMAKNRQTETKSSVAESNGTASPASVTCARSTSHRRTARSAARGDATVDERRKFHPWAVEL